MGACHCCDSAIPAQPDAYAVWDSDKTDEAKAMGVTPRLVNLMTPKSGIITQSATGATTCWDSLTHSIAANGSKKACGHRELIDRSFVDIKGHQFEKLKFGNTYNWMTYSEWGQRIDSFASALVKTCGLKAGDRVLIYADTQRDWMTAAYACWRQSATIVTAYATLGEEGVQTSINQTRSAIVVCDGKLFPTLAKAASGNEHLKYVIPIDTRFSPPVPEMVSMLGGSIQVIPMPEMIASAPTSSPPVPPKPEDVAVIMYTSGTTGNSKGVMITHQGMITQCASTHRAIPIIDSNTVFLAYLPLAHIMEMYCEVHNYSLGAAVGYGSPHTLTDTGVKLAKGGTGDAKCLKPTVMLFAPAVLDKVYGKINLKFAHGIKKALFGAAQTAGNERYRMGKVGSGCFYNLLPMKLVQKAIGGNVKFMATGSAPLSGDIQRWTQNCFNAPVRQGYGLTETCAGSCVAMPEDNTENQVGPPTPGTYLRLRDWEEGAYTEADEKNPAIGKKRGEVLLGGPTVAQGYLVDDTNPDAEIVKKNAEDFVTIDGVRYFCTGDIGQVMKNGSLQIIDRKKDLFKGPTGEYVALGKVEACLKLSKYVAMPMIYGRTGAPSVIALVDPMPEAITALAKETGTSGSLVDLCKNPAIVKSVFDDIKSWCKKGGLKPFEMPTGLALIVDSEGNPPWTPENGYLTSTLKHKRPIIAKAFAADIDRAYGEIQLGGV
jgi:long-subunit acyl-CoA synthetase (AMP-forming)